MNEIPTGRSCRHPLMKYRPAGHSGIHEQNTDRQVIQASTNEIPTGRSFRHPLMKYRPAGHTHRSWHHVHCQDNVSNIINQRLKIFCMPELRTFDSKYAINNSIWKTPETESVKQYKPTETGQAVCCHQPSHARPGVLWSQLVSAHQLPSKTPK